MSEICETMKVKTDATDNPDGFYLINTADFDPLVHVAVEPEQADKPKPGRKPKAEQAAE